MLSGLHFTIISLENSAENLLENAVKEKCNIVMCLDLQRIG